MNGHLDGEVTRDLRSPWLLTTETGMIRQVGIQSLNLRKVHFGTILHVELENGGLVQMFFPFNFQVGGFLGRTGGVEKSVWS